MNSVTTAQNGILYCSCGATAKPAERGRFLKRHPRVCDQQDKTRASNIEFTRSLVNKFTKRVGTVPASPLAKLEHRCDPKEIDAVYKVRAKFDSRCRQCQREIKTGEEMVWYATEKMAYCMDCGAELL